MREIDQLAHIPEFEEFFTKALKEAKEKYPEKVVEYQNLIKVSKEQLEEIIGEPSTKSKSYFFELTLIEDPQAESGYRWEVGKFKLNVNKQIVNMIFSGLIANINEYEVSPTHIRTEFVYSPSLSKWFQINFTKSSDSRIVGFVKIMEDDFVVVDKENTAKVRPNIKVERGKLLKYMDEYTEASKDMYFAFRLLDAST
jgi:hypothetical protein